MFHLNNNNIDYFKVLSVFVDKFHSLSMHMYNNGKCINVLLVNICIWNIMHVFDVSVFIRFCLYLLVCVSAFISFRFY